MRSRLRLLPDLYPSIAWSDSGEYLVVHDVQDLLKLLKASKIVRSGKEASLARQFRIYGFLRVRGEIIKHLREFRELPRQAWILQHPILTRDAPIDRIQAQVALVTAGRPVSAKTLLHSDEAPTVPSYTPKEAPNIDFDLDIFPSAQGVVATLPEEPAIALPPHIHDQSSVEGFHFDVRSHNAEFLALQLFLEQIEPNEDASPQDSDLTMPQNAYLGELLAGASEANGDAHPGGRERSRLAVAVLQPQCSSEAGAAGWRTCEVPTPPYASELQSNYMGSGLSTFDPLFQVAMFEQASEGAVYWCPPSDRVSATLNFKWCRLTRVAPASVKSENVMRDEQ